MKLSIIVPVYNIDEGLLRKCLDSVVKQTISDYEVVIVDDGSDRNCAEVCDEYSARYFFVKVIHQMNQGVSVARNTGIEAAVGEYIQFVDADDWLEFDASEKYYDFAEKNHLDIMLSGCIVEGGEASSVILNEDKILLGEEIRNLQLTILNNNPYYLGMWPMSPWAKLFRTEYIKKYEIKYIPGLKRMQDNLFCMYAYENVSRVGFFAYRGYHYRQNATSVCHKYNASIVKVLEPVLLQFKKFIDTYHSNEDEFKKSYYVKGIIILVTEYPRLYYLHEDNPKKRKVLLNEYKTLCAESLYRDIIENVQITDCYRAYKLFCFLLKKKWYRLYWGLLILQKKYRG